MALFLEEEEQEVVLWRMDTETGIKNLQCKDHQEMPGTIKYGQVQLRDAKGHRGIPVATKHH